MKRLIGILSISIFILLSSCTENPTGEAVQKTKLIFLTEEFAPLSFIYENKPTGMAVDVIKAICDILKIKPDIKIMLWKDAYQIALKKPNVIIFSIIKTKFRENSFYWLKPSIMKVKMRFYEKNGSNIVINKLEDAKKYTIGTTAQYATEEALKHLKFNKIKSFPRQEQTIQALLNGKVDLVVLEGFRKDLLIKKLGYSISDVLPVFKTATADLYIAVSKGTSKEVVSELQAAFNIIRENKTYYKIYKKWFLTNTMF